MESPWKEIGLMDALADGGMLNAGAVNVHLFSPEMRGLAHGFAKRRERAGSRLG
jgi:hypothetical protein